MHFATQSSEKSDPTIGSVASHVRPTYNCIGCLASDSLRYTVLRDHLNGGGHATTRTKVRASLKWTLDRALRGNVNSNKRFFVKNKILIINVEAVPLRYG